MKKSKKVLLIALISLANSLSLALTCIIVVIAPQVLVKEEFVNTTTETGPIRNNLTHSEDKIKLGFLFGIKGLLQIFVAPLSGILVDKTFPIIAIITAALLESISTIIYASSQTFPPFFVARALNSLGTPSVSCGSLAAISYYFKDNEQRRKVNGLLHATIFLAISCSPPLGAAVNQFVGQVAALSMLLPMYAIVIIGSIPFIIDFYRQKNRSSLELDSRKSIEVEDQIVSLTKQSDNLNSNLTEPAPHDPGNLAEISPDDLNGKVKDKDVSVVVANTPFHKLLIDPYIIITAIGLGVANCGIMGMYSTVPLYMRHKFSSEQYQQGLVFLPGIAFHLVGTLISLFIFNKWSRYSYIFIMITYVINAISIFVMLYIKWWYLLAIPIGINFFTIAISEYPLFPFLSTLVETRHSASYGSVSAIAISAISIAGCSTAFLSGPIVAKFGFYYYMTGICCIYLTYSPLLLITAKYWK